MTNARGSTKYEVISRHLQMRRKMDISYFCRCPKICLLTETAPHTEAVKIEMIATQARHTNAQRLKDKSKE